jgi:hypothetical protein
LEPHPIDSGGLDVLRNKLQMAREAVKRVLVAYVERRQAATGTVTGQE